MAAHGSRWSSGVCIFLLTATCCWDVDVESLAIKTTYYMDDTCEVEVQGVLFFGALSAGPSGKQFIGEF